jgi:hypothetical protein
VVVVVGFSSLLQRGIVFKFLVDGRGEGELSVVEFADPRVVTESSG